MFFPANIGNKSLKGYFCDVKTCCLLLGWCAIALAIAGIFLPLLPTTPFLLVAAWAFYRSSPQNYRRLMQHPQLGPYIRNFREHRAIPLHAKLWSVGLIWTTILYCVFRVVDDWWWAQSGLLVLAAALTWHILSFATLRRR